MFASSTVISAAFPLTLRVIDVAISRTISNTEPKLDQRIPARIVRNCGELRHIALRADVKNKTAASPA